MVYKLLYKQAQFAVVISKEMEQAKRTTTDVYNNLKSPRIMADFGYVFKDETGKGWKKTKTVEQQGQFELRNGAFVIAKSAMKSTRGLLKNGKRPDYLVADDVENRNTIRSRSTTQTVNNIIDETIDGMDERKAKRVFLGNYINKKGSLEYCKQKCEHEKGSVLITPIYRGEWKKGEIIWKDKYVWTVAEANEKNKHRKRKRWVQPIETLKKRKHFKGEFMQDPSDEANAIFKNIDNIYKKKIPMARLDGLRVYEKYNSKYTYVLGADTSEGLGLDSNTVVILKQYENGQLEEVATYDNADIYGTDFAKLIIKWAEEYGDAFIVPELNNSGHAVVPYLIENYPLSLIYKMENNLTADRRESSFYGWRTTTNKVKMIDDLSQVIFEKNILIHDIKTYEELKNFSKSDRNNNASNQTAHFDIVIALSLAIQGIEQTGGLPVYAQRKTQ